MSNYIFYVGNIQGVVRRMRDVATSLWGNVHETHVDSFWLITSSDSSGNDSIFQAPDVVGALSGYVRSDLVARGAEGGKALDSDHNSKLLSEITGAGNWPLGDSWTGSFAAVSYSKRSQDLVICNDLIGYWPLYYSVRNGEMVGGTSLIAISHCRDFVVDEIGVLQRITPPYCNYGRRTLLKDVQRLLPGEWVKYSPLDSSCQSAFDNTLCAEIKGADMDKTGRQVWDCLAHEIDLAVGEASRVCVGLSGGWDSRHMLAGVAQKKEEVECYTYGSADLYESRVANKCATAIGSLHACYTIEDKYFPSRESFESLVKKTESVNFLVWNAILDAVDYGCQRPVMLLGDMCEGIDGRNMKMFSSRSARRQSFMKGLFGIQDDIKEATAQHYDQWKEGVKDQIIGEVQKNVERLSPALASQCRSDLLVEVVGQDLEVSFQRVVDNSPPFVAMYDELFAWFHRVRFTMSSQILLMNSKFIPMSPAMSMRFMRLISTVHPRLRIRRRLINTIAKLPEFKVLGSIPSAQIPWLSARSPRMPQEISWALRSGLDIILIKRAMRSQDPSKRQRIMRTLNYTNEYRREGVASTVQTWFSGQWIQGEKYTSLVEKRANLLAWPLVNLDIATPANVSILLDCCQKLKMGA